jgi:uncharacterized membrane protein
VLLGLASVSATPVAGWTAEDAARITAVVTQNDPDKAQVGGAMDRCMCLCGGVGVGVERAAGVVCRWDGG